MIKPRNLTIMPKREPATRLMISETRTSNFSYHLRLVKEGEEKYSGGAGPALCGAELGWDTHFPLTVWGMKDHLPSKWCETCQNERARLEERTNG